MGELEGHYDGRAHYELKVLVLQDVDFRKAFGRVTDYFTSWMETLWLGLGGRWGGNRVPYRGNSRSADIRDRDDDTATEDSDDDDSNEMTMSEYNEMRNTEDSWPYETE